MAHARAIWARPEIRWLALITALGAALRFSTLGLQSYSYDEVATTDLVLHPGLWDTLRAVHLTESTPPLYYTLAWAWARVFGEGEVGLRSLSALIGTAIIPIAYAAGAALATRRVGLIAAALVAVNSTLFWYSQQARAYILLALLTALGILFFTLALRDGGGRHLLWWAVASALALATHYFAVFSVAPEALWLLVALRRDRRVWVATGGVAAAGIALAPLALDQERAGHADFISHLDFANRVERVPALFLGGPEFGIGIAYWLALAAIVAVAGALLWRLGPEPRRAAAIWGALAAAVVVLPILATAVGFDFFYARNLIAAAVPVLLVLAVAFGAGSPARAGVAAAAALAVCSLGLSLRYDLDRSWQRYDWGWVAQVTGPPSGPRVVVVNSLGDLPLEHYMALKQAPARVKGVEEIVFAGEGIGQQVASARLPGSFKLTEEESRGRLTFRRYVSSVPVAVRRSQVIGQDLRFYGQPIALVDAPPRSRFPVQHAGISCGTPNGRSVESTWGHRAKARRRAMLPGRSRPTPTCGA